MARVYTDEEQRAARQKVTAFRLADFLKPWDQSKLAGTGKKVLQDYITWENKLHAQARATCSELYEHMTQAVDIDASFAVDNPGNYGFPDTFEREMFDAWDAVLHAILIFITTGAANSMVQRATLEIGRAHV